MEEDKKVYIIGAGVAGLVAAIELEKKGYSPTILEASDRVGGRVKTDYADGFQFDHGFQVLLTAYPEVEKYLDRKLLDLRNFKTGALIYSDNDTFQLADPIREPGALFAAAFSPAGSLTDKFKIWRLSTKLKGRTIAEIFKRPSKTTFDYLEQLGFSDRIIHNFFRPFFSGIFLEKELSTSSRLFEFIFKMLSEGYAAVPAGGMQAIPDQLLGSLKRTKVLYNTRVEAIADNRIITSGGEFTYDAVVITTSPGKIIADYPEAPTKFKSTTNLYFKIPPVSTGSYIGLVPDENSVINNIAVLSDVAESYAPPEVGLISVSIIGQTTISEDQLADEVGEELATMLDLDMDEVTHLRSYSINEALPVVEEPTMELSEEQVKLRPGIYLAGDYLLGGSLNGAMVSGRQSAEVLMKDME